MRLRLITGNNNVAIKTRSTYISLILFIQTLALYKSFIYLLTYERYHCNSDGKLGIFDHAQSEETDPGRLRQRPTTVNGNVATKAGNTYISGTVTDMMTIPATNLGFSTTPNSQKLTLGDKTDNRKLQYGRFARQSCNFWQSVVVAIIWLIFCQHRRKYQIWRMNLDAICQSSRQVIISGFGGHIDISGCRSLLYLLANTTLHLYMVLYLRFVVGIITVRFIAYKT